MKIANKYNSEWFKKLFSWKLAQFFIDIYKLETPQLVSFVCPAVIVIILKNVSKKNLLDLSVIYPIYA